MKHVSKLFWLVLVLITLPARAEELPGSNRISREIDGTMFTFSPADEALVLELAPLLAAARKKADRGETASSPVVGAQPITLRELRDHKEEYLRRIARALGREAALAQQVKTYDVFLEMLEHFAAIGDRARQEVRSAPVVVWQKAEILAVLKRGEPVLGFKVSDDGEMVEFSWNRAESSSQERPATGDEANVRYQFSSVIGEGKGTKAASVTLNPDETGTAPVGEGSEADADVSAVVLPFPIVVKPGESVQDLIRGVEDMLDGLEQMGAFSLPDVFVLLHEVVEIGIVEGYLHSNDRRWLCDGVANYVAWKIIRDRAGPEAARAAFDLDDQLAQWAPQRRMIDLRRWKAAEHQTGVETDSPPNKAHYAFATRAVVLMVERHGEDFLPRLFREIGKTPRDKATMRTVEKAYRKLTGKNLSTILKAAVAPLPRPESA